MSQQPPGGGRYRTGDVLRLAPQVSKRQLGYWQQRDAISPAWPAERRSPGYWVYWSTLDIQRLRAIGQLHRDLVPEVAADISTFFVRTLWDELAGTDDYYLWLGGVRIHVELKPFDLNDKEKQDG